MSGNAVSMRLKCPKCKKWTPLGALTARPLNLPPVNERTSLVQLTTKYTSPAFLVLKVGNYALGTDNIYAINKLDQRNGFFFPNVKRETISLIELAL